MRISILTPSFNSEKTIAKAISSVENQGYADYEHIIMDAGSTDATVEELKKHPHVKWRSEPDKGQSDAINKAFSMSTGDIIGNLNADDYYLPGAFDTILKAFNDPKVSFVVGRVRIEPDKYPAWINDPNIEYKEMLQWWYRDAYCRNPVGFFYRKHVQQTVGGFDINNHNTMDLDFLLRARLNYHFTKIPEVLGVFCLTEDTKTAKSQSFADMQRKFAICDQYLPEDDTEFVKQYRRKSALAIQERREREWLGDLIALLKSPRMAFGPRGKDVVLNLPPLISARIAHVFRL